MLKTFIGKNLMPVWLGLPGLPVSPGDPVWSRPATRRWLRGGWSRRRCRTRRYSCLLSAGSPGESRYWPPGATLQQTRYYTLAWATELAVILLTRSCKQSSISSSKQELYRCLPSYHHPPEHSISGISTKLLTTETLSGYYNVFVNMLTYM